MKTFFLMAGVFGLVALAACSKTEQALTDAPEDISQQFAKTDTAPSQGSTSQSVAVPVRPSASSEFAPVAPVKSPASFPVKRCINLGNALEAPREGDWGYRVRAKDFGIIARAGFDTVRIPVRWDSHAAHRKPYQIDPEFMARIQQVVAQAKAQNLNVIIDVHHYEALMKNPGREKARFLGIWNQIARAFSNEPDNVYFELLNEPTRDISMKQLNAIYAELVPIIRASNPRRMLILGGNSWNSVERLANVKWPNDPYLVATFHDYGPHDFTHQGAAWMNPVPKTGRKWGGSADEAEQQDTYKIAARFKAKTRLPVLVGEFGVIDTVPQSERNHWLKSRRKTIEAHGFSWCAWDFSGAFKLYDISVEQWLPGVQDALFAR